MEMRFLGNTGLKISELSFGTLTFTGSEEFKQLGAFGQNEANTMVNMALDAGINLFDTADIYAQGRSEEMLGKALGNRRKNIILATKVRGVVGPGANDARLSRHHILEGCNASLRRLGTDYIDLYYVHSFDPNTALEPTLRALDDLVRCGKVRYIGCSNFAGWQLMKALAISDKHGWERFVVLQALYSLLARDLENELLPLCLDQELGVLTWSPLANGLLTGKYRRGKPRPQGCRLSDPQSDPQLIKFDEQKAFDMLEELDQIAREHQATVAQAALNYLLRKKGVTSVIIGVRTQEQLADNLKTTDWHMTPKEIARLDEISKPPSVYPCWFQALGIHDL
jgi:aryl-alcohol dehydrogenase-like predicted oxidoreductase